MIQVVGAVERDLWARQRVAKGGYLGLEVHGESMGMAHIKGVRGEALGDQGRPTVHGNWWCRILGRTRREGRG